MKPYDHKKVEKKWQKAWEKSGIYEADDKSKNPKYYSLIEFPFPSGDGMHTGHLRSYTAMDIVSRKRRMEGFDVLYPIGWDAFGLPTENYALKTGIHPSIVTKKNTDNFRRQLKAAGFSFDWKREVNTSDPAYYKWTQWIFLQFFKHKLAYKKKMVINWCPKDKIGLANEEVIDGKCERCGTPVEKREKEQWMLAITKYADRLEKDLDTVDYVDRIKTQQRNWIGKSEGAEIDFLLNFKKDPKANDNRGPNGEKAALKVFTTRPDTIFGATYLVLAPEHLWVTLATDDKHDVLENKEEIKEYIKKAKTKSEIDRTGDKEKTGVLVKGVVAINPATKEEISIWVADYVLPDYGTGAIMAVPAHDERDFEFAKKYNLPIKEVIEPLYTKAGDKDEPKSGQPFKERDAVVAIVKHWSEDKYLVLKWKKTDWRGFVIGGIEKGEDLAEAAKREVIEETGYTSVKFVREIPGTVNAQFYHVVKSENRWAKYHPVYLELTDDKREETKDEEKDIHEVMWVSKKEMPGFLDWVMDMQLMWHRAMNPNSIGVPEAFARFDAKIGSYKEILVESGKFTGKNPSDVKKEITESVGGKMVTTYKLRDWIFSRQRYWGEPIPMINCEKCGWVPVPEKELPVKLPNVKKYQPTDTGESPLAAITKWVNVKCPQCKAPAKRETDTMPNWAGSSWYFMRFTDPKNKKAFADEKKLKHWMPVDLYNGGMEHTTLHLLYSRFWNKFLFDIGVVPTSEPYKKRTSHGLILAEGGVKMSKSLGNVVSPDGIIDTFGADTLRVYEMFMGPFEQSVAWSTDSIVGPRRFLEKVWRLQEKLVPKKPFEAALESVIHYTMKKVTEDIESMSFNTAVSSLMILANEMDKRETIPVAYYKHLLHLLAPFAPHITEEIWANLGEKKSIHLEKWPRFDESKIVLSELKLAIQVNGKVRAEMTVPTDLSESEIQKKALEIDAVKKWIDGKEIKKAIYVKGKLINIVI